MSHLEILFFYPSHTSFIDKDLAMLKSGFEVRDFFFRGKGGGGLIRSFLSQFLFLLRYGWRARVLVSEFAGYQSFLPGIWARLTGKPFLIISAGTDAASYPSINYGNYRKPIYRWFTRASFRFSTHISPVHEKLMRSENHFYTRDSIAQGIFEHVPGLQRDYTVIPYGYDAERWPPGKQAKIVNSFITIAFIPDHVRYVLKGIDLILEAAESFPGCRFLVVGMTYEPPRAIPANVEIMGKVANADLPEFYKQYEFYFQLSISEGHPNALCEAMLCGCIPIGSAVTSIPDIIGDTGFVVGERKTELVRNAIAAGLASDRPLLSQMARERIETLFPFERREQELQALIRRLASLPKSAETS
jgi:glycosyltransferase involved in cell wall biosynthesis